MNGHIDLRSDTVTVPTPAMRAAMAEAAVGDDVYGEDPTISRLEELGARMVGKAAAVFVPTGTMGNMAALLAHTHAGDEVILEADSHVYYYEVGGLAQLGGLLPRLLQARDGLVEPDDLARAFRAPNLHFPVPTLLCLENTHNRHGGVVMDAVRTSALAAVARARGLAVHLDGARIFNAAAALGVTAASLCQPVDSVMFCLSKGLAAPVGSLLAGSVEFIARARKARKVLGGGMRQAGIIAAAGLVALTTMVDRLAEDHAKAKRLAEGLAGLPGLRLDPGKVQTNIVAAELTGSGDGPGLVQRMAARGVKLNAYGPSRVRMVTHKDVSAEDIETAIRLFAGVLAG
ncbi:MAG: GntG family PLP-dependent aldolase [Bacillota bacterium]